MTVNFGQDVGAPVAAARLPSEFPAAPRSVTTRPEAAHTSDSWAYRPQRDTGRPRRTSIVPRSTSPAGTRVAAVMAWAHRTASGAGWTHGIDRNTSGPSLPADSEPRRA